jgi:hypothetical protein
MKTTLALVAIIKIDIWLIVYFGQESLSFLAESSSNLKILIPMEESVKLKKRRNLFLRILHFEF